MKRGFLRILCAALLLMIVTAAAVGAFSATREETVYAWQRVFFALDGDASLFSADGTLVQTLRADENGHASTDLLPVGRYIVCSDGRCVRFSLRSDCSVAVESGCGWTDGKYLHLTDEAVGTVRAEFLAQTDGFCVLTLSDGVTVRTEAVCCTRGQTVTGEFLGVPYGTYLLSREGGSAVRVTVDERYPTVLIALTGG